MSNVIKGLIKEQEDNRRIKYNKKEFIELIKFMKQENTSNKNKLQKIKDILEKNIINKPEYKKGEIKKLLTEEENNEQYNKPNIKNIIKR